MRDKELGRYLTMLAFTAPGAAMAWFVFHNVYGDLSESEKAIGYVDPTTQMGVTLGYYAMIGATLVLGIMAAWAALQSLRILIVSRRR